MNVKIIETGETLTLAIREMTTGIDFTGDLIGNAGAFADEQFIWSEEDDAYLATRDTFEWWQQYITDTIQTEQEAAGLAVDLNMNVNDIRDFIDAASGLDYGRHRQEAIRKMQELRIDFGHEG